MTSARSFSLRWLLSCAPFLGHRSSGSVLWPRPWGWPAYGEDVDPRQLMDEASTDQASVDAEARLLQAFPGASEVAG